MNKEQPRAKLRRFQLLDTDSLDTMRDVIVHRYGARYFDRRRNKEKNGFRGVVSYLAMKNLDLSYGLSTDISATFLGNESVRQQFVLSGRSQIAVAQSQFEVSEGNAAILPAESEFRCEYHGEFSQLLLRIPETALRSKLAGVIGRSVTRNVGFEIGPGRKTPAQQRLQRLIHFFVEELDREGAELTDFQLAEFEQLLIVSFLDANPHSFSHLMQARAPAAAPWQVRLVEEYIETNWDRPITIEKLAQETGVGVRNIFVTFKKTREYTPMAFLQRVRLEHARRMLQMATETTSVTTVGLTCGFLNAGHFARYYRQAFNELPSATLAAARIKRVGRSA